MHFVALFWGAFGLLLFDCSFTSESKEVYKKSMLSNWPIISQLFGIDNQCVSIFLCFDVPKHNLLQSFAVYLQSVLQPSILVLEFSVLDSHAFVHLYWVNSDFKSLSGVA